MSSPGTQSTAAATTTPAGVTPPGATSGRTGFLSDVIVELGFATREAVEQAVRAARSPGTTVARVLVDMNAITEEQLARATAERYGIDYIELDGFQVDPAAANLIAPAAAQRHRAVPVAFLGQVLLVAMGDPADSLGVADIATLTARKVRPAVASAPALDGLLAALPLDETQAPPAIEQEEQPTPSPAAAPPPAPAAPSAPAAPPASVAPPAGGSELRAELDELKGQLADVLARLSEAPAPVEAPELPDRAALEARLAEAEAELEEARVRVREAKEVSAELDSLREALAAAEAGIDTRARAEAGAGPAERERAHHVEAELRRIRADADARHGDFEALRGRLTDAETELVRVRAELDNRGSELDAMRARAESAEAELESAARRAGQAEAEAAEAQRRAEQAHDSDERADGARQALAELREESERERERSALTERDLRASLRGEETRRAELEQRLSEVEASAFVAERAFEELREAQARMRGALRDLAHPDASQGPPGLPG